MAPFDLPPVAPVSIVPIQCKDNPEWYHLSGPNGPLVIKVDRDILRVHTFHPVYSDAHTSMHGKPWIPYKDNKSGAMVLRDHDIWAKLIEVNQIYRGQASQFACFGRDSLLEWYKSHPIQDHVIPTPENHQYFVAHMAAAPPSSAIPWEELQQVTLRDMRCFKRHEKQALVCRILTKAKVSTGISFAVEDVAGRAIGVWLEIPFSKPAFLLEPSLIERLYPIGATLIIREPLIQFGRFSFDLEICVRTSTDIVEIPPGLLELQWCYPSPSSVPVRSASEYKDSGNSAFKKKDYLVAIRSYTLGVLLATKEYDHSTTVALLLNRSQAYLDHSMPGSAYRDCIRIERLLEGLPSSSSSLSALCCLTDTQRAKLAWRKLKAAYNLRLFDHAGILLAQCKTLGIADAARIEQKLLLRKREKDGHFEFDKMYRDYKPEHSSNVDVADYVGPVKVVHLGSKKGRGVVLTRDVKAGTVLWVEKALLADGIDDCMNYDCTMQSFDSYVKDEPYGHSTIASVAHCHSIHKTIDDPSTRLEWDRLCPRGDTDLSDQLVTESQRLNALCEATEYQVDAQQIYDKCSLNAFNGTDLINMRRAPSKVDIFGVHWQSDNLYSLTSMCNHSCLRNISAGHIGDVIIVTAICDMQAGTELEISYCETVVSYNKRAESLDRWKVKCECQLCMWDQADQHEKRASMMENEWQILWKRIKSLLEVQVRFPKERIKKVDQYPQKELLEATEEARELMVRLDETYGKGRTVKYELAKVENLLGMVTVIPLVERIKLQSSALKHSGVIFNNLSQRRSTGLIIRQIPYEQFEIMRMVLRGFIKRLVLKMEQMEMPICILQDSDEQELRDWKKTARWIWTKLYPARGGEDTLAEEYEAEQRRL